MRFFISVCTNEDFEYSGPYGVFVIDNDKRRQLLHLRALVGAVSSYETSFNCLELWDDTVVWRCDNTDSLVNDLYLDAGLSEVYAVHNVRHAELLENGSRIDVEHSTLVVNTDGFYWTAYVKNDGAFLETALFEWGFLDAPPPSFETTSEEEQEMAEAEEQ